MNQAETTPDRSLSTADSRRSRFLGRDRSGTRSTPVRAGRRFPVFGLILLGLLLVAAAWFGWVFHQINFYAHHDEAQSADAIAVFGAAEYDGHPSPVLRARLDHALTLYRRGLAAMVITLGGQGDAYHSEGSVGRDYLIANGIPESHIIAETRSGNTASSATQLSIIAKANGLNRIIAVSDGTHLFRIRALCAHNGLSVWTSPRPVGHSIARGKRFDRLAHEMLSYTVWQLGF